MRFFIVTKLNTMLNLDNIKNALNAVLAEKGHLSSMRIKGFMVLIGLSFLIMCMGFNKIEDVLNNKPKPTTKVNDNE